MSIILRNRLLRTLLMVLAVAFLVLPAAGYAADDTVESVTVTVSSPQGTVPPMIAKRIATSVTVVGENVLIGRKQSELTANRLSYEKIIKEVFERVLLGYSIDEVTIEPGSTTHIAITVVPWGDVVQDVTLQVDYGNITNPEIQQMLQHDMGNVAEQINNVMIGLPVDAVEWASGVSKSVIREFLEEQLPEFRANFDVVPGTHTIVKLSLEPAGIVIQDVHVSLRSRSIPNLLLGHTRPALENAGDLLKGLPVAFVERHREYFDDKLSAAANNHPLAQKYGIQIRTALEPASDTDINVDVETTKYRLFLEGYLDFGHKTDNTSVLLHVGQFVSHRDEIFTETKFIPGSVTLDVAPGWGHKFGTNTLAGIRYDLSEDRSIVWVNQPMGRNFSLRLERTPSNGYQEVGIRYKMHDYLSAEYIISNNEQWLRLVANL